MATTDVVVRVVYDALRAHQVAHQDPDALMAWDSAPEWMRDAAELRVMASQRGEDARLLHEQWRQEMYANGWSHGPRRDTRTKTHPHLVPYEKLPALELERDTLAAAIVAALTSPG